MFICRSCSYNTLKWSGKCPNCHEWNSLEIKEDEIVRVWKIKKEGVSRNTPLLNTLSEKKEKTSRILLKSKELSNVLWGGMVRGSFMLLSGEPGIGKSTLSLQIADWYGKEWQTCLYVSAEENEEQLSERFLIPFQYFNRFQWIPHPEVLRSFEVWQKFSCKQQRSHENPLLLLDMLQKMDRSVDQKLSNTWWTVSSFWKDLDTRIFEYCERLKIGSVLLMKLESFAWKQQDFQTSPIHE